LCSVSQILTLSLQIYRKIINRYVNLKIVTQIWQVSKSKRQQDRTTLLLSMIIKLIQKFILVQFVTKKDKVYFVVRIYKTHRRD